MGRLGLISRIKSSKYHCAASIWNDSRCEKKEEKRQPCWRWRCGGKKANLDRLQLLFREIENKSAQNPSAHGCLEGICGEGVLDTQVVEDLY